MTGDKFKVPSSMLSPIVDPGRLGFEDTGEVAPLSETIGQERAVEALEFGLQMKSQGFNIYVSGPVGTGKGTLVRQMVKRLAQAAPAPSDWCYVNNFQDLSRPACLSFPAGQGCTFKREMAAFIDGLRQDIPAAFDSKKYLDAKAKLHEETETKKKALFHELRELSRKRGFGFEETPVGFGLVPLKAGQPMTDEDMEAMTEADQTDLTERRKLLEGEIREFHVRIHALEKEADQQLHHLDRQLIANVMEGRYETLRRTYRELSQVTAYLERVQQDIIHHYKDFLPREGPAFVLPGVEFKRADLTRYQVNLLVEHDPRGGAPVVDESHPTYTNLIGKIERRAHLGVMYTDFTEIRAGAVLLASGGFLLLNAIDLLRQPFSWDALKRVIKTGRVTIEDPSEFYGFSTAGLRPEPVPVSVKVILVGPPMLLHLLQTYEEDFSKMFKVKADFDVEVDRDERHERQYAQFVAKLCRDENLPHFYADAVAEVIRQGHRFADRHDRLSLRFSLVSDLIREAGYWARKEGHAFVTGRDVEAAVAHKRYRSNLTEEWVQDEIREGTLMVSFDNEVVGQVNGLSVHQLGDYAFGRPSRITARTFVGTKGVIDIQREAELAREEAEAQLRVRLVATSQAEAAVRNLATTHPYDAHVEGVMSLRSHTNEIAGQMRKEIQERLEKAGVNVVEARISHLAYAPEIASAMLRRQQASAIIAARQKIVEGAVGMVEMALDALDSKHVVTLDEERKAAMVSNLLVVLCSDRDAQPIVNTGSIYQ